jgi:hypothetical protein
MSFSRLAVVACMVCAAVAGAVCLACADEASSPPLPVIGRTRSGGFCTTFRETIAPAVLGLMKTDELLAQSRAVYAAMPTHSPTDLSLDRIALGKTVAGMAHDLAIVRGLTDDPKRFPKAPSTEEDRSALQLRAELRAVAERQERALDLVNGVLQTDLMQQMSGMFPHMPRYRITKAVYGSVAVALGEQQHAVGTAEAELTPAVVAASKLCALQPSPSPSP